MRVSAYVLVFGRWGFPALGIAGAGLATVVGSSVSATMSLGLMLRSKHRAQFATLEGRGLDLALLRRLLRFGLPNGIQWALEALAFTVFLFLIGRLGAPELAATSITFTLNMVAAFPMMGLGQAVGILVGQRLGHDRPDLAERTTWTGFRIAWLYMTVVAVLYVTVPGLFVYAYQADSETSESSRVVDLVKVLLRFVAVYSLFDSMNLIFSFALRGAGDTRLRDGGLSLARMADHGPARMGRLVLRLGTLLGLGLRQRLRHRLGLCLPGAFPLGQMEVDARHRASRHLRSRSFARTVRRRSKRSGHVVNVAWLTHEEVRIA